MFKYFLVALAFVSIPVKILAEAIKDKVEVSYSYYSDNVGVEVLSPFISIQKRLNEKWGISASFQTDAISAASMRSNAGAVVDGVQIDAVSGASGRMGFDDLRFAPTVSFMYEKGNATLTTGMYYSNEVDYETVAGFIDISNAINDANTIFSFGGSYEEAEWSPIINRDLALNTKEQRQLNASVMQLINDSSYVQLRFSYVDQEGFLSSPYRVESIVGQFDRYPGERESTAIALQYVTALGESVAVHINYRYYSDDWKITSNTVEGQLFYDVVENLTFGIRGRYYSQEAADFVKDLGTYNVNDTYIVSDYKFTAYNTITLGASMHYKPGFFEDESVAIQLSYDRFTTDDNDYIQKWYGKKNIEADMATVSLTYAF